MGNGPRPGLVDDLCHYVLDLVGDYYDDQERPLPEHRYVPPGPPPWDCEQVTVQLFSTAPMAGDVTQGAQSANYASAGFAQRSATLIVQVVRCVPSFNNNASAVLGALRATTDAEERAARLLNSDPQMIESALIAATANESLPRPNCYTMLEAQVQDDGGDMVGVQMMVRFELSRLVGFVPDLSGS